MKILLLTNIYPMLDVNYEGTKVCHYFAKEWEKQGHDVRVIRFTSLFPRPLFWLSKVFKESIKAKTGSVVYTKRIDKPLHYIIDGISVVVLPIFKLFPHQVPSFDKLKAIVNPIIKKFETEGFYPDVVTAHFRNPQLMALSVLKEKYPNAKTCMVMHCNGSNLKSLYGKHLEEYMKNVDVWGFRSYAFRTEFQANFGIKKNNFVCISGIPSEYIRSHPKKINSIRKFVFVGSLFELKRIDDTICALARCYKDDYFEFHIIGDGAEKNRLEELAKSMGVSDRVFFEGKKNRNDAQSYIEEADVFVMVSAHEAFGLVYVEAMAKGCITIGTEKQGIDGVIIHGQNGFLCPSCNVEALASLIDSIRKMSIDKLQRISNNAIATASNMTNEKVAELYLKNIVGED